VPGESWAKGMADWAPQSIFDQFHIDVDIIRL